MKRTLTATLAVLLILPALICLQGCEVNKHYYEYSDTIIDDFRVYYDSWQWNPEQDRYEYVFYPNHYTRSLIENSTVSACVYLRSIAYDDRGRPFEYNGIQNLPYISSYKEGDFYTETFDFTIGERIIVFHIQASDLSDDDRYLDTFDFTVRVKPD